MKIRWDLAGRNNKFEQFSPADIEKFSTGQKSK
jgi:hypothetical protein